MLLGVSAGSVDGVAEDSANFTDERDLSSSSGWMSRPGLGLHSNAYISIDYLNFALKDEGARRVHLLHLDLPCP